MLAEMASRLLCSFFLSDPQHFTIMWPPISDIDVPLLESDYFASFAHGRACFLTRDIFMSGPPCAKN